MGTKILWDKDLKRNTGFTFELKAGQLVKITSQTIIDFVCFNLHNTRERFDQARTKANQRKVFISTGDQLVSKLNNTMAVIVEDTFQDGHHDLQEGMCSRKRHELAAARGMWEKTYGRPLTEMPTHGCTENLSGVLAPFGIPLEDIPSPFNMFQDMIIKPDGELVHSHVRPQAPGGWVVLRAEMDLLCALSVCPDSSIGGTTGAHIAVLEAA